MFAPVNSNIAIDTKRAPCNNSAILKGMQMAKPKTQIQKLVEYDLRNKRITKMVDADKLSFAAIAKKFGITRQRVAAIYGKYKHH